MRKLRLRNIFQLLPSRAKIQTQVSPFFGAAVFNHVLGPITKEAIGEFLPKIFHHSLALKDPNLFKPPFNS